MSGPSAGRIRVLSPELASQIAAGEVVERPASVVKELVENALDAGSRRVTVEITDGGGTHIRVTDDGGGMTPGETRLAVERHATSKLGGLEALMEIRTLGFRGEALPSIASVSRFSITSRSDAALSGLRCDIDGGELRRADEVGCPVGTVVSVRDLFFNVPARRKFLKTERTESGHIAEVLLQLGLARPDVHFTLIETGGDDRGVRSSGARVVLDLPRHPGLRARAEAALARRIRGPLHAAAGGEEGLRWDIVLGSPDFSASSARNVYLLVNGRPVRDRMLLRVLCGGYGEILPRGRYPLAVVHLQLAPAAVDVNVHPQKYEVRFADERGLARALHAAVTAAVSQAAWGRAAGLAAGAGEVVYPLRRAESNGGLRATEGPAAGGYARSGGAPRPAGRPLSGITRALPLDEPGGRGRWSGYRYLGQILGTYLLLEGERALVLLDQHAAHERVTFGRIRAAMEAGGAPIQNLLFPVPVELAPAAAEVVRDQAQTLVECGFAVDPLSGNAVSLRGVPALLVAADPAALFRDVVDELATGIASESAQRARDLLAATMACHGSIRAGKRLGEAEVWALLDALEVVEQSGHCPHGRPVVMRLSESEIRRRFGRE